MTAAPIHSSRPDHWVSPRPTRDPMGNKHGPLLPMEQPRRSLWQRLRNGLTPAQARAKKDRKERTI